MEKDKKLTKIKNILVYLASMDINSSCKEISDIRVIMISTLMRFYYLQNYSYNIF